MDDLADIRKGKNIYIEKAKKIASVPLEPWRSSSLDQNCHEGQEQCRAADHLYLNLEPWSFFHQRCRTPAAGYVHHLTSLGRRSGNSSLENLNSLKEKTVTY